MRFRQHQDDARSATRRLLALFVLIVLLSVLCTNGALALAWRLMSGGLFGYPRWFFETNTLVALVFILGGCWIETQRLRGGGAHVAGMVGGREVVEPRALVERRLRNVVDEVAIASGLKSPRVFVLEREEAINAFAAGWEQQDSVVAVTRGALERLTRDELQGVVAHEFGHILNGDTRLNMRLIGYVFGLQMIFNFGRGLAQATDARGRRSFAVLVGLALMAAGFIGWMAGRALQAAVSRQREFLADAHAVQLTRLADGIGGALRKIAHQVSQGQAQMRHANTEVVSHLLLSGADAGAHRWLATHPPLAARVQRIFGRPMAPVPALVVDSAAEPGSPTSMPLPFVPVQGVQSPSETEAAAARSLPAGGAQSADTVALAMATAEATAETTLHALREFTPSELLQAATLAFLVPAPGTPEHRVWRSFAAGISGADAVLDAVACLPVRRRQPWLERLMVQAACLAPAQRRTLREQTVRIVRADGKLAVHELLIALWMQHDLSPGGERLAREPRHLPLLALGGEVALVTAALGGLLAPGQASEWSRRVMGGLGLPDPVPGAGAGSSASVGNAIARLRRLAITQSPALAKQWIASQPEGPMSAAMADALRIACLLVDTPMPPRLVEMFDPIDGKSAAPGGLAWTYR